MKICVIASGDYFSSYGGGQIYVKNLVKGLNAKGHKVIVISIKYDNIKKHEINIQNEKEIKVIEIKIPYFFENKDIPMVLQSNIIKVLEDVLLKIKPDIVHANGWKDTASLVCKYMNIPCVITAHHGGIVCPNGMLMNENEKICNLSVSMENCTKCALHFVPGGKFWSPLIQKMPKNLRLKIAKFFKNKNNIPYITPSFQIPLAIDHKLKSIEVLKKYPDKIISPSKALAKALIRNGISENKIEIIPHGIRPLKKRPLPLENKKVLRFGYIGRISYVKGLHVIIEALKMLPKELKYELHIYGDAANKDEKKYKSRLITKSKELPVIWHGKIKYSEIEKAYMSFDVMILPSIYLEAFGLTVLESFSVGRPVISSKCGGPEDIIRDGVDGVLIKPNNPKALAEIMEQFIKNPAIVKKLAKNIKGINTLENHINDIESLYQKILKGKSNEKNNNRCF
jgi:glycosyltransferase involved in cell wall biosynthesis